MPRTCHPRFTVLICLSLVLSSAFASAATPPRGAYHLPNGDILALTTFDGALRFFMQNGRTGSLVNVNEGAFVGSEPGMGMAEPTHTLLATDTELTFNWEGKDHALTQIPLSEKDYQFNSGGQTLRGRLLAPSTGSYRGIVILVHGSENYSALDNNFLQYLLAANDLAVFVYDKRGTGGSQGKYTHDIPTLAADVVAAINFVDSLPEAQAQTILLAGFSQGGWVAPMAAVQSDKVRALLLGYGPAVSLYEEDRWGYAYWLQEEGYSAEDLAKADQLFALLKDMQTRGRPDRWKELKALIDQYKNERWYQEGLPGTDSSLAALTDTPVPLTLMYWWTSLFGLERFVDYDPASVLAQLDTPSYWLFAGEDASMPTEASIKNLKALSDSGLPMAYKVYPDTSHGIVKFEPGRGRERPFISYQPGYFDDMIRWLQEQATTADSLEN
ncbi:MAG: alpha/beta hydrolase [Halioglobus sp.]